MSDLVTIVTATTGRKTLEKCIESVKAQDHPNIQHLIVVDGKENYGSAIQIIDKFRKPSDFNDVVFLPYPVGTDRWNGHLMYAAATYLAKGDHIMYLDDDNWIEPNHVSSLYKVMTGIDRVRPQYAYSLRNIVSQDGDFLVQDNCESLGPLYSTCLDPNDYLIDVNCYFFQRELAIQLTPIWNRQARPVGMREVDRELVHVLRANNVTCKPTNQYTVNYRLGGNLLSVQSDFFKRGNEVMLKRFGGNLPWQH